MIPNIELSQDLDVIPILPLTKKGLVKWLSSQPDATEAWCRRYGFNAHLGKFLVIPGQDGNLDRVLFGLGNAGDKVNDYWSFGAMGKELPAGTYGIEIDLEPVLADHAVMAWVQGAYQFDQYRKKEERSGDIAKLCLPEAADLAVLNGTIKGGFLARDLINSPASHMGPEELAAAAVALAKEFDGTATVTVGDDL